MVGSVDMFDSECCAGIEVAASSMESTLQEKRAFKYAFSIVRRIVMSAARRTDGVASGRASFLISLCFGFQILEFYSSLIPCEI